MGLIFQAVSVAFVECPAIWSFNQSVLLGNILLVVS